MLTGQGLRTVFRDTAGELIMALDVVEIAPAPGRLTVVQGPSGSGKSTLLYTLAGLQPPDSGVVSYEGVDLYGLSEGRRDAWRRRTVGFVFQEFHLVPELDALANVALPASFGRTSFHARSRSRELLTRMNVPVGRRSILAMSRGERQRIAIARALLFDPPVILADEPTASLDRKTAGEVASMLAELAREKRTVLVASHDPAIIEAADDRLSIEHGAITADPRRAHSVA